MMGKVFRFGGSLFFTLSGLAYVLLPPRSSTTYFDSSLPAKTWGVLFAIGGIISLWGVLTKYTHTEKLGVAFVAVATLALAFNNILLMIDAPVVWTRLGGSLFYLASCMWASERWYRLGKDVEMLGRLVEDEDAERDEHASDGE